MKTRKLTALLLVFLFVLGSLPGLAAPEAPAPLEAVTIKFCTLFDPCAAEPEIVQAINAGLAADGLPFTVEIVHFDDYGSKVALAASSGEPLDVVWIHTSWLSDHVSKKMYYPLTDIAPVYAPDIMASLPEQVQAAGSINGELYAFGRVIPMAQFKNVYNIRGDLRKKYNMEEITTIAQLEQYFDNVLANEEGMYCIAADYNTEPLLIQYANYYFPIGDEGRVPLYVDPEDETHTVKTYFDSEAFANLAELLFSWREKGYLPLDDSSLIDAHSGFVNGRIACVPSNIFQETERIDDLKRNLPDAEIETVHLQSDKRYVFQGTDNMLGVVSSSKHPNEAVAFINWIKKNQNNFDLWSYGVEGVNYNLDGESISLENIAPENQFLGVCVWMWNDVNLARFSKNASQEYIEKLRTWDEGAIVTPYVGFRLDQSSINAEIANVSSVIDEYIYDIVKGAVRFQDVKDEFLGKLEAAGIKTLQEECQKQLDAYLKN